MDEDLPSQYLPDHIDSDLTGDNSDMPATCSFCGRTLSSESGINSNLRTVSVCGDCKFLLLEDYGNPSLQYHHSRPLRDMDCSSSYHQPTSMHTTPDSSRRWRRVISDAESDGFTSDSFYAESESYVSFGGAYRVSYVDSDAVSFSGYGGDSDASVDGPAFLDADIFAQSMGRSDVESDSDIDPMHAGVLQWDSDDQDYVEYLEQLVENDGLRRGAPPASASFVDSLPLIVISEDHQKKSEGLVCAICKDLLTIGIEVNRLPCLHLYHPPCILPWLSARNSCPLCRHELPTDDIDYELGKRNSNRMIISQIQEHDGRDDSSSVSNDGSGTDNGQEFGGMLRNVGPTRDSSDNGGRRGRWLFLASAPIVSIMGVVFVMWLGNSLSGRVGQTRQHPQGMRTSDSGPHNQRVRRRWWF